MDNNVSPKTEKNWKFWGKNIGLPILIIIIMIIGMDIVRMPKSEGLKMATFTTLEQKPIDFNAEQQPVVLYFWGSWCVFCRHTSPMIEKLYQEGYPVVSVAMQSGTAGEVSSYLKEHQLSFPVINDPDGEISQAFSVVATPTIAIVDHGKISIATSGWTSQYGLKFRFWLAKLIGH